MKEMATTRAKKNKGKAKAKRVVGGDVKSSKPAKSTAPLVNIKFVHS